MQLGWCVVSAGWGMPLPPAKLFTPPTVQIAVERSNASAGLALAASGHSALSAMARMASQPAMRRDVRVNPMRGI